MVTLSDRTQVELDLMEYLKGKEIAIVGNAYSILDTPHDIDKYDVVIRFNEGFPDGIEQYLGTRTDILALCWNYPESVKRMKPKYVIWTPFDDIEPKFKHDKIFHNRYRKEVNEWVKVRPSTGLYVLYLLAIKFLISSKHIHLFGFDFFKTNTWYNDKNWKTPHNGEIEKEFITKILNMGIK